jgi:hypothetical protein
MSLPNTPIVNAGLLYVNGLALDYLVIPSVPVSSFVSGKAFIIEPGQARDSTNTNDILLDQQFVNGVPYVLNNIAVGAVVNGLFVGANGCDQAVLAASSLYNVYVIASSKSTYTSNIELGGGPLNYLPPIGAASAAPANPFPAAGLLSLASNPAPYLPYGYDMYRLVGSVVTNSSADIVFLSQYGNGGPSLRTYSFAPVSVLSAGAATTFTAVSLASGIPTGDATQVILNVSYTSALAANTAQFLPYGSPLSGGTVGVVSFGGSVVGLQTGVITVPVGLDAGVPEILYKVVSGDTLSLSVVGYR